MGERVTSALDRIESAIARIEAAAARPLPQDPDLAARHEALRAVVHQTLGELDSLIAGAAS